MSIEPIPKNIKEKGKLNPFYPISFPFSFHSHPFSIAVFLIFRHQFISPHLIFKAQNKQHLLAKLYIFMVGSGGSLFSIYLGENSMVSWLVALDLFLNSAEWDFVVLRERRHKIGLRKRESSPG